MVDEWKPGDPPREPRSEIIITPEDTVYLQKFDVKLRDKISNAILVLEINDVIYEKKRETFERILQQHIDYYQGRLSDLREAQVYLLGHRDPEFRALGTTLETTIALINDIVSTCSDCLAGRIDRITSARRLRGEILPQIDGVIATAMANPVWYTFVRNQDLGKRK